MKGNVRFLGNPASATNGTNRPILLKNAPRKRSLDTICIRHICWGGVTMMGQQKGGQEKLFYSFNLEDHVPQDHLLRGIDDCLDLSGLRQHLAEHYSHTGRPSVDPELMIRMLIIGYSYGIRSERLLCDEVHLNLAYRWFCRLGLEDAVPDHSTFSKNRHGRFRESGVFRWVFDEVVRRCMAAGLVKGEGFAV